MNISYKTIYTDGYHDNTPWYYGTFEDLLHLLGNGSIDFDFF